MSNSSTNSDDSSTSLSSSSSISSSTLSSSSSVSSSSNDREDEKNSNRNEKVKEGPQINNDEKNVDDVNANNGADKTALNIAADQGGDDYLYEDILGGALDESEDDLDDRKHPAVAIEQPAASSNKSGSACGSETCAALLAYLRTTISDRDRAVADLEDQLSKLKEKHAAELQKLTTDNESLRKQFSVAKAQAARLRTELRDWLRLPLNRTIVALKKTANLKSVSEIIELAPALGSSAEGSENQPELAELEQRLKAYHSLLKAKNAQANPGAEEESENSRDSISLPGSLKSSASVKNLDENSQNLVETVRGGAAKVEAPPEIEEGEVASSEDEALKEEVESGKKKKKRHSEKAEHGKKKHHKEKSSKGKKEKDGKEEAAVVKPPAPQQSSGEWIGLLRKHVGGAWPAKRPASEEKKPSIDKRLGSRPVWKLDKDDRRHQGHHDNRGSRSINNNHTNLDLAQQENSSQSSSSNLSTSVVVESKLVPVSEVRPVVRRSEKTGEQEKETRHHNKSSSNRDDENRGQGRSSAKEVSSPSHRSFAQNDNNRGSRKRSRSRTKSRERSRSKLKKVKETTKEKSGEHHHSSRRSSSRHRRH